MTRIYDISRGVEPGVWVWPGDREYDCSLTWRMSDGASVNVGQVTMSCHTGTHMDAPFHFSPEGHTAEAIPLEHCIGECEVLPLEHLAEATAERVLVRSGGAAPTLEQIATLGSLKLLGTDGHSVDPMDSRTLDVHHALWKRGAVILEELALDGVPDGRYRLVALPIRLEGMDAAPVRAVLLAEA